jgi:hypothetical protein
MRAEWAAMVQCVRNAIYWPLWRLFHSYLLPKTSRNPCSMIRAGSRTGTSCSRSRPSRSGSNASAFAIRPELASCAPLSGAGAAPAADVAAGDHLGHQRGLPRALCVGLEAGRVPFQKEQKLRAFSDLVVSHATSYYPSSRRRF